MNTHFFVTVIKIMLWVFTFYAMIIIVNNKEMTDMNNRY